MATVRRGPTAVDIGPAAATVDGLAAIGRLSSLKVSEYLQGDVAMAQGAGPIERRRATPEEIARLNQPTVERPERAGPAMHLLRPAADAMAASRQRGAERHQAVMAARRGDERTGAPHAARRPHEEEPAMAATTEPVLEVPCGSCLHEPVCSLKAKIPTSAGLSTPVEYGDGLRQFITGFRIECDHQLVSLRPVEAAPIRADHGGESWRTPPVAELRQPGRHDAYQGEAAAKADRAAQVVAALARHGGDKRAAASELGMKLNVFSMVLKFAHLNAASEGASA